MEQIKQLKTVRSSTLEKSRSFLPLCAVSTEVSGLIFLAFCVGAASQQFVGATASRETIQADLCAMHGLAELRSSTDSKPGVAKAQRLLAAGVVKVALENIPQLVLQSSFFALVFDELTPLGRAKVLSSILLGLVSASQKILEAMKAFVRLLCEEGAPDTCYEKCYVSVALACFMVAPMRKWLAG